MWESCQMLVKTLVTAVMLLGMVNVSLAQDATNELIYTPLMLGEDISQMWCNACHVTSAAPNETAMDSAPPFSMLAPLVAEDPERYRAFLTSPHVEAMQGIISLSRDEIEGLLAYIKSQNTE
jgi:hypothetical protein